MRRRNSKYYEATKRRFIGVGGAQATWMPTLRSAKKHPFPKNVSPSDDERRDQEADRREVRVKVDMESVCFTTVDKTVPLTIQPHHLQTSSVAFSPSSDLFVVT
uniref:Uncharacterized protein n=1 Tax=Ascaris lumbricoides TaxID=6252 RepID=A0A0M3IE16_ASCLU